MTEMSGERIKLQQNLQVGCVCQEFDKTFVYLLEMLKDIRRQPTTMKDDVSHNSSSSVCLMNCSLIEILCYVYRSQVNLGRVCSCLVTMIEALINEKQDIEEFLIAGLFCKCSFRSYASMKALIEFQHSKCVFLNSTEDMTGVYNKLAAGLTNVDPRSLNILSAFEHSMIVLKAPITAGVHHHHDSTCNVINVKHTDNMISMDSLFEILDASISLPLLLGKLNECNNDWIDGAIQTMLRILLIGVDRCTVVKRIFVQNYESIFTLMTSTTSLLILERCCTLVKEILDYKTTMVTKSCMDEDRVKLAHHFLHISPTMRLFHEIADSKENDYLHGFGGPFIYRDNPSLEGVPADRPCFQSFLLLYLSSLSIATSHICSKDHDGLVTVQDGLANVEKLWKLKIQNIHHPLTLFEDQDDHLVEVMLYCLEIYRCFSRLDGKFASTYQFYNPHAIFFSFLRLIRMDYQVLLDLLISEETCFLLYFVKYLKLTLDCWGDFRRFQFHNLCKRTSDDSSMTEFELDRQSSEVKANLNKYPNDVTIKQPVGLVDYEISDEDSLSEDDASSIELNKAVQLQETVETKLLSSAHQIIMEIFNNLTIAIVKQMKKKLFPYNVEPLIKLLRMFQNHQFSEH